MIVGADGFRANLNSNLRASDLSLPLTSSDKARFLARVGLDNHTYLRLNNALNTEVVKARSVSGEVVIERGQGGTMPLNIPAGACAAFEITTPFLNEFLSNSAAAPAICEVVEGSGIKITSDADTPCKKTFSVDEQAPVSWRSGNDMFTQDKFGVITSATVTAAQGIIADGTYKNATIIVEGGQIKSIQSGTNQVYTGGGLCTNCGSLGCGCNTPT